MQKKVENKEKQEAKEQEVEQQKHTTDENKEK